jgi:hypothetical protein
MKICSRCKKEKSLDNFTKKKTNKDGLDNECRECKSERKKQWKEKNKNYKSPSREKITFTCVECGKERVINKEHFPEDYVCPYCRREKTMKEKYGYETNLMKSLDLERVDLSSGYRTCSKCGRELPFDKFTKNKTKAGGIDNICLECNVKKSKEWNEKNPKAKRDLDKRYQEKNKEKILERKKNDYYKNREERLEKAKEHYKANKEYIKERINEYRKTDRGKAVKRASESKRRAQQEDSDITADFLQQLKEETEYCELCGKYLENPELDHIIPLAIGGPHYQSNVRYICKDCNIKRPRDGKDIIHLLED